ncbi:MAG TPA: DUF2059 domain-containing protein [Frateuria sp.]|uniref:DUF2059 domain-containing protein n=1 Tax=Frateuria sp. TaxID=2211372 RepID=UPI002DF6F2FA|nr:DUF2059 domain-containing protein [Frateuria sp.]
MRKWIGAGLGLLLAAGAGSVVAATHKHHKAATHKPAIQAEASEAQVRQLIEASGVDRMLGQMNKQMAAMMQQQVPCVPASYWQNFIDANGVRELTERMVPIYQRHFSAADIQGLLKFYRSPLGRKVITEMPATMAEGMQLGQEWGRQRAQAMLADLHKSGRIDAQGRCPAAPAAGTEPKLAAPAAGSSSARQ